MPAAEQSQLSFEKEEEEEEEVKLSSRSRDDIHPEVREDRKRLEKQCREYADEADLNLEETGRARGLDGRAEESSLEEVPDGEATPESEEDETRKRKRDSEKKKEVKKEQKEKKENCGGGDLVLPKEVWREVAKHLDDNNLFSFAMTCKTFRIAQQEVRPKDPCKEIKTIRMWSLGYMWDPSKELSRSWIRWAFKLMGKGTYAERCSRRDKIGGLASLHGHLEELKWLRERCCYSLNQFTTFYAARGGHINVLEWLRDQGLKLKPLVSYHAARGGHLQVLKWLKREGHKLNILVCQGASEGCHLNVLQWARTEGCRWNKGVLSNAAIKGSVEMLIWMKGRGFMDHDVVCRSASLQGQIKVLEWLKSEGYSFTELRSSAFGGLCGNAAFGGHLEALQWLRAEGCPWDKRICEAAVMGRRRTLEVLQWVRREGCPWDPQRCYKYAEMSESVDILDYIEAETEHIDEQVFVH